MSKTFKKGLLLLIITLGFLLLSQTCVNAATIDSPEALKEAFEGKSATIEGTTITLTGDVEFKNPNWTEGSTELEYELIELKGDDYVLDLNGNTLKIFDLYINEETTLTINNSKGNGLISNNGGSVIVAFGGKLIVNNGTMDYLANEGTAIINNGTIGFITNYGTITIEKGNFGGIWQTGNATINGGIFTAKEIDGSVQMSNINLNAGTTLLTGGEFTVDGDTTDALVLSSSSWIDYTALNDLLGEGCKVQFENTYSNYAPPENPGEEGYGSAFFGKTVKISEITEYEKNLIKKIAPDGKNATLKSVKPKDMMESDFLLTNIVNKLLNDEKYYAYAWCTTEELDTAEITIEGEGFTGTYEINVTYDEPAENSYVQNFVNKLKKFDETPESAYQVTDLGLINYYLTSVKSELWNTGAPARALRFSDEIIKLSDGGNIKFYLDVRAGEQGNDLMFENAFGEMTVFYNDYAYANKQQGIHLKRVIYIPANTDNTTVAYIQAAQDRINKYLGAENLVSVTYGGTLNSLEEDMLDSSVPTETTDGNYYNITVKGRTYKFYIIKGTEEQLKEPVYQGKDINTNVEIKSTDANIPLDTSVVATKVRNNELKEILDTDNYEAYEITLYSDAKEASIKKLDNGKFLVNIPVPEKLEGKVITVYYVDSDGNKSEHPATVENNVATFETDHFSTYVLTEKVSDVESDEEDDKTTSEIPEEVEPEIKEDENTNSENINNSTNANTEKTDESKNPQTGDNIIVFITILGISILGTVFTLKVKKQKNK